MKVVVFVKSTPESEAGMLPDEKALTAMGKFNEELVQAGIMLGGEGLTPSSRGKRVHITSNKPRVIDGPFAEAKELVGGYWIWKVKSMDEAVEWAQRCAACMPDGEWVLELRPIFESEEFGEEFTPELRALDQRQRAEIERQRKS